MSYTYRIRLGDDLDAADTQKNFNDLRDMVNTGGVGPEDVEFGAVHTRHCETATAWKSLETKSAAAGALTGSFVARIGASPATYTTFNTQAFLVRASVVVEPTNTGASVELQISISGSAVVSRVFDLIGTTAPLDSKQVIKIAWMAVATADTMVVELDAKGTNAQINSGTMSVLAVRR
jgi:hypothetical protein